MVSTIKYLNKTVNYRRFPEIMMFLLFLGVSALIFFRSYWGGTYISPDSTNYLRAAQSILNGYGLKVYAEAGWNDFYFSHWPIGYPFLIACVSFITGADVYLASKILTILTLAGIFGLLYHRFHERAWIYTLIMVGYPSFLENFYYTWSEQLFLFGSLLLTFEVINIISEEKPKLFHYFNIVIACLLMFFVRYAGIQAIGVICLAVIYIAATRIITKKPMSAKIIPLTAVGIIVSAVSLGYLYLNYVHTGYIGGSSARGEVHDLEYIMQSAINLFFGQMTELSYIFAPGTRRSNKLGLFAVIVILFFMFFQFKKNMKAKRSPDSLVFLTMSIYYVLAFLFFRGTTEVDEHYARHLLVSTILFAFGCITIFFENQSDVNIKIRQFAQKRKVLTMCFLLVWFGVILSNSYTKYIRGLIKGTNVSYQQTKNEILSELSPVAPKTIVLIVFGWKESFVNFLRPDILAMDIMWGTSLNRNSELFDKYNDIYLYLDEKYIIPDGQKEIMQKYSLLSDYVSFRNSRLIKIK